MARFRRMVASGVREVVAVLEHNARFVLFWPR